MMKEEQNRRILFFEQVDSEYGQETRQGMDDRDCKAALRLGSCRMLLLVCGAAVRSPNARWHRAKARENDSILRVQGG